MSVSNKISVVIITFNEEVNIERCLKSVENIADEIIILDSYSTDNTKNICSKYDKVIFHERGWENYSASKNWGNSLTTHDWILSLDADEAISLKLEKSILTLKTKGLQTAKFNRITNYCGHWVKFGGWYPDTKTRIFNKNSNEWIGTIHEELNVNPSTKIIHLIGDCLHYSYNSIAQHHQQTEKFTTIQAKDLYEKGKKSSILKLILSPLVKFVKDYIIKLGFLDARTGFTIAKISAYATYLKYKKLRLLHLGKNNTTLFFNTK